MKINQGLTSIILRIVIFLLLFFQRINHSLAQAEFSYDKFETQVMNYDPIQNDQSDTDYNKGLMILSETKKYVEGDPNNFTLADYYNILAAFLSLEESNESIDIAFKKIIEDETCCEYFLDKRIFKDAKFDSLRNEINDQVLRCENSTPNRSDTINLAKYAQENNLDLPLVKLMHEIAKSDEKHRNDEMIDWSKQKPLDLKNQRSIDSLLNLHKSYIGKSMVGDKFAIVMWSVIQHSNVEMMERYLNVVQIAVRDHQLAKGPFKMLIDRFYGLKYGYQIFGTQSGFGFELADETKRAEIESKYGLE